MGKNKPDNEADVLEGLDRGEKVSLMEPLLLSADSRHRPQLTDLALELAAKSASLRSSLPPGVRAALAELVRNMNCYYSNLIEGHNTHPVDIERALNNDYSKDKKKRDLQLEAKAHVTVQSWIDAGGISDDAASKRTILEIHRRFCENLPEDLLVIEGTTIMPGELRTRDVAVGNHVAVSPNALTRFLDRYEEVYMNLGPSEALLSVAAAHHRLLWIHPFIDGNGRVARLVSHAQLLKILDTGSIWSVARGLARNENEYKRHLMACDETRRGALDGRGNLSEETLADFIRFFLQTCLDQVTFMEGLVQPQRLRERILAWADEEARNNALLPNARLVLEAVLFRGEVPRGEVPAMLGLGERQARRVVSGLVEKGVMSSTSDRAPLHLSFPAALASRWMPGLFPEAP